MSRGGARTGAGRKKGQATKKSQEVADRAAGEGITPLEVMLKAMRHYDTLNDHDKAASIAKDAAPYMHPRLSAIQHDVSYSDATIDAALQAELERLSGARQSAGDDSLSSEDRPGESVHTNGDGS